MYLGIDLGTSGVKAILVDSEERVVAQATGPLTVQRPHPLWSEQDPEAWWAATNQAVASVRRAQPDAIRGVRAIGLSGQMHGATLLDRANRVLRPAILWNDGRSGAECAELERRVPTSRAITGNAAMPGFTAPKLLWVAQHEPEIFRAVAKVLLPKDYLRLRMTGEYASDMSDSAGTLWLDVARRAWSDELLAATGLQSGHMPRLFEGTEPTGLLSPDIASAWGMEGKIVVAGGGGDNAAGAIGVGVVAPGTAFLSLGSSGVLFVSNAAFSPNPNRGVHAFCHALPGRWHQMSVILSASSCLSWVTRLTGAADEATLLQELEQAPPETDGLVFLPYLSGERTPHNDPHAKGVFFGLTHSTQRAALARAVLEGVAFAFADGQAVLEEAGAKLNSIQVIGGGSRSLLWGRILASVLGRPLLYPAGADMGPAFGAARLARLSVTGEPPEALCTPPRTEHVVEPDARLAEQLQPKLTLFRRLYTNLREAFRC
ncbi:xylulokinase [Hyalangium versicolor]|uniref:xylulokinase n=1 Tax=Hyalangium versicolor TaxID=2861190 RepID=UPI002102802D|nr:xylulokinase [Hyalangium versicolor]